MTADDLDRILGDDAQLEPSPAFSARVMQAVHLDAAVRLARRSTWAAVWPAVAAASIALPLVAASRAIDASAALDHLALPLTQLIGLTLVVTLGTAAWCAGLMRQP